MDSEILKGWAPYRLAFQGGALIRFWCLVKGYLKSRSRFLPKGGKGAGTGATKIGQPK